MVTVFRPLLRLSLKRSCLEGRPIFVSYLGSKSLSKRSVHWPLLSTLVRGPGQTGLCYQTESSSLSFFFSLVGQTGEFWVYRSYVWKSSSYNFGDYKRSSSPSLFFDFRRSGRTTSPNSHNPGPPTKQLRYDHWTNLVDEHSLCAANVAACRAFDKLTPSISNRICPVETRAIQPVGFPFPLPILISVGFPVIGRSAKTLTHILPFLRNCPIIARRAASMARYERRPALQLLIPYLPKPSCVPSGLQPLLHLPLRFLLYFVRFGYSTSPLFRLGRFRYLRAGRTLSSGKKVLFFIERGSPLFQTELTSPSSSLVLLS